MKSFYIAFFFCTLSPLACHAQPASNPATEEEFAGPFPSWYNLRDHHPEAGRGDAAADTAALQDALNTIGQPGQPSVLYLPAGTYNINDTLTVGGNPSLRTYRVSGISILGEDAATVFLNWVGTNAGASVKPSDGNATNTGVMLAYRDVGFSREARITWLGNGRARMAVFHRGNPAVDTYQAYSDVFEHADDVFKGFSVGLQGGTAYVTTGADGNPLEETLSEVGILRCQFIGNSFAGVVSQDPNVLNWNVRDSLFQSNHLGVFVSYGGINVRNSVFLADDIDINDISVAVSPTGIHDNYSRGSGTFFYLGPINNPVAGGNPVILQRNRVFAGVFSDGTAPVTLLDNQIQADPAFGLFAYAAYGQTPVLSVGNRYSSSQPFFSYRGAPRLHSIADITGATIDTIPPALPIPPPRANRRVFEVTALTGEAIQAQIQAAQALNGHRPIVHVPAGDYQVARTITIPAGSDVQLVGDGPFVNSPTTLIAAAGVSPTLALLGPSRATLKDFRLSSAQQSSNEAVRISNADQPQGRVYMEGPSAGFAAGLSGLFVDGLDRARVEIHDDYLSTEGDFGTRVVGGPHSAVGEATSAQVTIRGGLPETLTGVSFDVRQGGKLLAEDFWDDGLHAQPFATVSGASTLMFDTVNFSASPTAEIAFANATGHVTLLGVSSGGISVPVKNSNPGLGLLVAESTLSQDAKIGGAGTTTKTLSFNNELSPSGPILADRPGYDNEFIRAQIALVRSTPKLVTLSPLSADVTDVRVYRVGIASAALAFHVQAAP